jgi:hypothetical protein
VEDVGVEEATSDEAVPLAVGDADRQRDHLPTRDRDSSAAEQPVVDREQAVARAREVDQHVDADQHLRDDR